MIGALVTAAAIGLSFLVNAQAVPDAADTAAGFRLNEPVWSVETGG